MDKRFLILSYLKENGTITQDEALDHCKRAHRLAGHIFALREKRWPITTERLPTLDGKSTYARYRLNRDRRTWPE